MARHSEATLTLHIGPQKLTDGSIVYNVHLGTSDIVLHAVDESSALALARGIAELIDLHQVTALMAADLIRLDAFRSEADAIRALMALKLYSTFEIMSYVEKAIYDAQQETVAQMMSDRPGCERKVGR